ncbi:MAG TPA: glycine cleavage system aminomethyltransferase GcvT [Bacteroidota bacterium]|nr:glycine cleavage system aminomethyltransferase GcvT [Bacteroidota bacterium]
MHTPKETPFLPIHRSLGARIVEFGGYLMPVSYTGIIAEHRAVRTAVGLFDVSHMGEFLVSGPGAAAFVQKITTNDITRIACGGVQYSVMCTPGGGIIDDLLVYHLGESFMLVVNASNTEKDLMWIRSAAAGSRVEVRDAGADTSLLAVQGPRAPETLRKIADADIPEMKYYTWTRATIAGVKVLLSRTGYTGEAGFELYFDSSAASAKAVWDAVMSAGVEFGIRPAGLGARDTLRLEMGFCLYGNDIDETTNPLEAGLGWVARLDKGEFIGRDALVQVGQTGVTRKFTGFLLDEPKAVPRRRYRLHAGSEAVGEVTSGTMSPSLERGIGLGYLPPGLSSPGNRIEVMIRDRAVPATTVKLPFVNSRP